MISVRMIGAWFMHPDASSFHKWVAANKDLAVWNKLGGLSFIDGKEYPATIEFVSSDAYLVGKLQYSHMFAYVVD